MDKACWTYCTATKDGSEPKELERQEMMEPEDKEFKPGKSLNDTDIILL